MWGDLHPIKVFRSIHCVSILWTPSGSYPLCLTPPCMTWSRQEWWLLFLCFSPHLTLPRLRGSVGWGQRAANHLAKILPALLDTSAAQGHAFAFVRRRHVRSRHCWAATSFVRRAACCVAEFFPALPRRHEACGGHGGLSRRPRPPGIQAARPRGVARLCD